MPDNSDFFARVAMQLQAADDTGDTIIVATLNAGRMVMQTHTPRGPNELVHIARRLLEEAHDRYAEAEAEAANDAAAELAGDRIAILNDALGILPDPDEIGEEEG